MFTLPSGDQRAASRHRLLRTSRWFPEPDELRSLDAPSGWDDPGSAELSAVATWASGMLADTGIVKICTGRELSGSAMLAFASRLGSPMPFSTQVEGRSHEDLVLDLRLADVRPGDWTSVFRRRHSDMCLHTERAWFPADERPRLLFLHCVVAPPSDCGGQTILVRMADVLARLNNADLAALTCTTVDLAGPRPTFLDATAGDAVLWWRDVEAPIRWRRERGDADADRVAAAFTSVVAALYERDDEVYGIHWAPGDLLIFDNARFFHGRTRTPSTDARVGRHLRSVRIR